MITGITYQSKKPDASLAHWIESFWLLANITDEEKTISILPDGRIDLFFSKTATEPFHVVLLGLENSMSSTIIAPRTLTFAVSFKLLGAEYVLKQSVAPLLNGGMRLPNDFWEMEVADLDNFDACCNKVSQKIKTLLSQESDPRKLALFNLIYDNNGDLPVNEMASKVHWTSRQINRYFNQWFGLSLKAYCNILRFRASFAQIKAGKFFPELNFADQAHFIRTVKKYAGVAPKALNKNKNDRFIQFSTLPKK